MIKLGTKYGMTYEYNPDASLNFSFERDNQICSIQTALSKKYRTIYIDFRPLELTSNELSSVFKLVQTIKDNLEENGFLFIRINIMDTSIKLICDQILSEENYISTFPLIRQTNLQESYLAANDFLICYIRDKKSKFKLLPSDQGVFKSRLTKRGNKVNSIKFPQGLCIDDGLTKTFKGSVGGSREVIQIKNPEGMIFENGVLQNTVTLESCFCIPNYLQKLFKGETIIDRRGQSILGLRFNTNGCPYIIKEKKGEVPNSVFVEKEYQDFLEKIKLITGCENNLLTIKQERI